MTTASAATKARLAHVFLTDEGEYGLSAASPQLPGFAFLRATAAEARRDLGNALKFAGHHGPVQIHHIKRYTSLEGVEYTIRLADDGRVQDRIAVADMLQRVLTEPQNRRELLDEGFVDPVGDIVFVAVLPADRLSWLFEQMDDRGDMINVAHAVIDAGLLFVSPIGGGVSPAEGWASLDAYGLNERSTVGDLVRVLSIDDARPDERPVRRSRGLLVPA